MMPDENFTKDALGSGIYSSHIGTQDQDFRTKREFIHRWFLYESDFHLAIWHSGKCSRLGMTALKKVKFGSVKVLRR
jgi:hypothetical protein